MGGFVGGGKGFLELGRVSGSHLSKVEMFQEALAVVLTPCRGLLCPELWEIKVQKAGPVVSLEEPCPGSLGLDAASGTVLGIPPRGLSLGREGKRIPRLAPSETALGAASKGGGAQKQGGAETEKKLGMLGY